MIKLKLLKQPTSSINVTTVFIFFWFEKKTNQKKANSRGQGILIRVDSCILYISKIPASKMVGLIVFYIISFYLPVLDATSRCRPKGVPLETRLEKKCISYCNLY